MSPVWFVGTLGDDGNAFRALPIDNHGRAICKQHLLEYMQKWGFVWETMRTYRKG